MWRVMSQDGGRWFTVTTGNANPGRNQLERVYFLNPRHAIAISFDKGPPN
jgi:hypothetical protein